MIQQVRHTQNVALRHVDFFRDLNRSVAAGSQVADFSQQFHRTMVPACEIFNKTHQETLLFWSIPYDCRNFCLPKRDEGLQSALTTNEVVTLSVSDLLSR